MALLLLEYIGPTKALAAPLLVFCRRSLWALGWGPPAAAAVLALGSIAAAAGKRLGRGIYGPERQLKTAAACTLWWLLLETALAVRYWHLVVLTALATLVAAGTGAAYLLRDAALGPMFTAVLRRTAILGPGVTVRLQPWPPAVVLTDVRLWEWLVGFANERFFFGPMAMPCDGVTCSSITVDLRPTEWWRLRTVPLAVSDFRMAFHRAHADEWSPGRRQVAYTRWRRGMADWVCSLVEPGDAPWAPRPWQWAFDLVAAHLDITVTRLHLRLEDRRADVAFGIAIASWHLTSERPGRASLGAPRRTFNMEKIQFYLDPTCRPRPVAVPGGGAGAETPPAYAVCPRDGFICAERGCMVIDLPNIWQCLVNHQVAPYGQGKRLRVHGNFSGVLLVLHEEQLQHLVWDLLGAVGRYDYMKFKRWQRTLNGLGCRPLSAAGRARYAALYGTRAAERALHPEARAARAAALEAMEATMSFAEIVHRRRDARGWALQPAAPGAATEGGDWALEGDPADPQRAENDALAALVRRPGGMRVPAPREFWGLGGGARAGAGTLASSTSTPAEKGCILTTNPTCFFS